MYNKFTSIAGKTESGEFKCLQPNGHWQIDKAISRARRSGIVGRISIEHHIVDTSGKGRGGHDGRWLVSGDNTAEKISSWSEFGVEHP